MASGCFKGVCRLDGDSQAPWMGSCGPWSGQREAIHRAAEQPPLFKTPHEVRQFGPPEIAVQKLHKG